MSKSRFFLILFIYTALSVHSIVALDSFSYSGFTVNQVNLNPSPYAAIVRQEIRHEIDIVNMVELPQSILDFFHTIPIQLVHDRSPNLAAWYDGEKIHWNVDAVTSWNNFYMITPETTVLHELLHAFHDQKLKNGYDNKAILKYYSDAANRLCYYRAIDLLDLINHFSETYYLKDQTEFFAVTAVTYLRGYDCNQEPHTREEIQKQQPAYYADLQKIFGPTTGRYIDPSVSGNVVRCYLEFEDDL